MSEIEVDYPARAVHLGAISIPVQQIAIASGTAPTDAEITSAFGDATYVGAGFLGWIDDSTSAIGTSGVLVASDGSRWWYVAFTKVTSPSSSPSSSASTSPSSSPSSSASSSVSASPSTSVSASPSTSASASPSSSASESPSASPSSSPSSS